MSLNNDAKLEGRLTFAFKNDKEFGKFLPEHLKVSKFAFDGILLNPKQKMYELKIYRGAVMTMKKDAKLEEEMACHFKIEMRNLMNFNPIT